jgi:hypothetical protein
MSKFPLVRDSALAYNVAAVAPVCPTASVPGVQPTVQEPQLGLIGAHQHRGERGAEAATARVWSHPGSRLSQSPDPPAPAARAER